MEHCGTGGRAARFDGGVDLRLRRDGETILVQCKHWNAYQVLSIVAAGAWSGLAAT